MKPRAPASIDIVMPVFNCERFIADSIKSVIAQSLTDWRLIIVDDMSTDKTAQIIDSFMSKDRRILILKGDHRGVASAINLGLTKVTAEYVARLDGDDIALPERLQVQHEFMLRNPDVIVVGSGATLIDEQNRRLRQRHVPIGWEHIRDLLKTRNCLCHPTVLIRTTALRQVGGYRDKFRTSQDYDLWLRLSEIGRIENLPQSLLLYRRHSSQISTGSNSHRQTLYSVGAAIDFFLRKYRLPESETLIDEIQSDDLAVKLLAIYAHGPAIEDRPSLNRHALRLLRHSRTLTPEARRKLQHAMSPFLSGREQLKGWLYSVLRTIR